MPFEGQPLVKALNGRQHHGDTRGAQSPPAEFHLVVREIVWLRFEGLKALIFRPREVGLEVPAVRVDGIRGHFGAVQIRLDQDFERLPGRHPAKIEGRASCSAQAGVPRAAAVSPRLIGKPATAVD